MTEEMLIEILRYIAENQTCIIDAGMLVSDVTYAIGFVLIAISWYVTRFKERRKLNGEGRHIGG